MSTHNIYFYGETRKITTELSSNTSPLLLLCSITDYMIGAHSYHDKGETGTVQ